MTSTTPLLAMLAIGLFYIGVMMICVGWLIREGLTDIADAIDRHGQCDCGDDDDDP